MGGVMAIHNQQLYISLSRQQIQPLEVRKNKIWICWSCSFSSGNIFNSNKRKVAFTVSLYISCEIRLTEAAYI